VIQVVAFREAKNHTGQVVGLVALQAGERKTLVRRSSLMEDAAAASAKQYDEQNMERAARYRLSDCAPHENTTHTPPIAQTVDAI